MFFTKLSVLIMRCLIKRNIFIMYPFKIRIIMHTPNFHEIRNVLKNDMKVLLCIDKFVFFGFCQPTLLQSSTMAPTEQCMFFFIANPPSTFSQNEKFFYIFLIVLKKNLIINQQQIIDNQYFCPASSVGRAVDS